MTPAVLELVREFGSPVLFDEGVEAARNACVAGASIASAAIAAAAWYDNPLTGSPAVLECMARVSILKFDVSAWIEALRPRPHPETLDPDFTPGFGFVAPAQADAVLGACTRLLQAHPQGDSARKGAFFLEHRRVIEDVSGRLNHAGLAALYFVDHQVEPEEAERTFVVSRIEIAIAEAQRARARGLAAFPFFQESYVYEGKRPPEKTLDLTALRRELGLV